MVSDVAVQGAQAAFVGSTLTEVEIFIWIMPPLLSKRQVSLLQIERILIILHRKIVKVLNSSVRHDYFRRRKTFILKKVIKHVIYFQFGDLMFNYVVFFIF